MHCLVGGWFGGGAATQLASSCCMGLCQQAPCRHASLLLTHRDSAGVTTGPVTVPFVLAIGIGFSKVCKQRVTD